MDKNRFLQIFVAVGLFLFASRGVDAMPRPAQFQAQNWDSVRGAKPFRSLKIVPNYAARRVPAGGKTKFYGEIEIKTGRKAASVLRVHLYEWNLKASPDATDDGRCAVDLYLQRDRRDTFRRVSSLKSDDGEINDSFGLPVTFVDLMWLNNKTQTVPIVRFCCQALEGFYGPFGENLFLTFAKGLNKEPSVQTFQNYSSHSNFVDWCFDGMDVRGNRQFIRLNDPLGVDSEGDTYTFWQWNEKELSFLPKKEAKAK